MYMCSHGNQCKIEKKQKADDKSLLTLTSSIVIYLTLIGN